MKKIVFGILFLAIFLAVGYYFLRQREQAKWFKIVEQSGVIVGDRPTVILDPGHGGRDAGAVANGLVEKDLTLELAQKAKSYLESAGYSVVLTRDSDRFVSLEDRAAMAYKYKDASFVSIHLNSFFFPTKGGAEVLFDQKDGLAKSIADNIKKDLGGLGVSRVSTSKQSMFVLTHFPGNDALVEPAYLSNKSEADLLKTDKFKTAIAQAIAGGVLAFKKPTTIIAVAPTTTPPSEKPEPKTYIPEPSTPKNISLTFNIDNQHNLNPQILDILEAQNVKVTFFVSGQWAFKNPELTKRIAASQIIGNYTWSGPRLSLMRDKEIKGQIDDTENAIKKITGVSTKPNLRLPYNEDDAKIKKVANDDGYKIEPATLNATGVWNKIFTNSAKEKVLNNAVDGSVVLFDNDNANLLDETITKLKILGFGVSS